MKKEVKQIQYTKEVTTFIAIDGTVFHNEGDCEAYEQSAECAISKRIADMTVIKKGSYTQEDMFLVGDCDNQTCVVIPKNHDDVTDINQYIALKQNLQTVPSKGMIDDDCIGKHVVICYNYEEDWVWVHTEDDIKAHWDTIFAS